MIKSTAVVIGLLFLISSTYYLAFWGSFGIDVFQYLQVSDIIKGVAYPFRAPGAWLLIFAGELAIALSIVSLEKSNNHFQKDVHAEDRISARRVTGDRLYLIMKFISLLAACAGACQYVELSIGSIRGANITGVISSSLIAVAFTASYATADYRYETRKMAELFGKNEQPKVKNGLNKLLDYSVIACSIYFLVNALSLGLLDARKIKEESEYNYVSDSNFLGTESLSGTKNLVYLGSISDKYIFTYNNASHFVVDKSKIPILSICHYALNDSKTYTKFIFADILSFAIILLTFIILSILFYLNAKKI